MAKNELYQQQMRQQDPMGQQFNDYMRNPIGFLAGRNMNIPQQYANNPKGAVQYLLNNGTVSQEAYNYVMQVANRMGLKLS